MTHDPTLFLRAVFEKSRLQPFLGVASESFSERSRLCTFQILGGCQGQRVGVTTVSNLLILVGWVRKVFKIATKNRGWKGG